LETAVASIVAKTENHQPDSLPETKMPILPIDEPCKKEKRQRKSKVQKAPSRISQLVKRQVGTMISNKSQNDNVNQKKEAQSKERRLTLDEFLSQREGIENLLIPETPGKVISNPFMSDEDGFKSPIKTPKRHVSFEFTPTKKPRFITELICQTPEK
jgi:hypothetical protein